MRVFLAFSSPQRHTTIPGLPMKRTIPKQGSLEFFTVALWLLAISLNTTASADDPVLYGPDSTDNVPSQTVFEHDKHVMPPYRGPYGGGPRVYGVRYFHPPGKHIYAPPPAYKPGGFFPGPFWPYYGFYRPYYFGGPYPYY